MNPPRFAKFLFLASIIGALPVQAGIVRFNATIDGTQAGTNSTATGTAVMLYDVTANKLDISITLSDFAATLSNSHIHEGTAGTIVVPFGNETLYTRTGNTLTATFTNLSYTGSPQALLHGDAYINFHTAAFPAGEIRGQLIPEKVKLAAIITGAQETPATASTAYGAAQATYDPVTDKIDVLISVYNFTNTFSNSHIHESTGTGVPGGVVVPFGNASAYVQNGTTYTQLFSGLGYSTSAGTGTPGNPVNLLSEKAYVNVHSNVNAGGEIRGQLYVLDSGNPGRLVNVSARAQVGTGNNVLISGMYVQGTDPVRVLVTARGPSIASLISGTLADPVLSVHDVNNHTLFTNDNVGTAPFQSLITGFTGVSFQPAESGVLLVLPPGGYTGVVSGAGDTTGIALAEAFEVSW